MTTSVDIIEAVVLYVDYTKFHGWKTQVIRARKSKHLASYIGKEFITMARIDHTP